MLNKYRLLTPGPTPIPERVRLALARDMIHHRKSEFHEIMQSVQGKLQTLFGTEQVVLPLAGSGTASMTAALYSLFTPGDTVVTVNAGKFGERFTKIAESRGLQVIELKIEWGKTVTVEQIKEVLENNKNVRGVCVQMSETSTGALHPIKEIAAYTSTTNTLLVVDGISGVSLSPCPMDEWGVDCLLTGSQKGLMLPPGLAFIALSERAWQVCEATKPGCFYFNLPGERKKVLKGETNFTTPVNLIVGLNESLDMLLENGLEEVYRKQWALTQFCRASAHALGLECFVKENYAWGLTSILLPPAVDGVKVVANCAQKYGVYMAGGQDQLKGRIVRVGHMGWVDWADLAAGMYALNQSIIEFGGFCGCRDFLEQGLLAYQAALQVAPGEAVPQRNA